MKGKRSSVPPVGRPVGVRPMNFPVLPAPLLSGFTIGVLSICP